MGIFQTWLEVGLVRKYRPDVPVDNYDTKAPSVGDIVIDNPVKFFKSPKNKDLNNVPTLVSFVAKEDGDKFLTQSISSAKPGITHKKRDLVDITFYVPEQFRKFGSKIPNVWLYLPIDYKQQHGDRVFDYNYFIKKIDNLKKGVTLDKGEEKERIGQMQQALGLDTRTAQMGNWLKFQQRIEDMIAKGIDPTVELKKFAEDPSVRNPKFIPILRKHNLNLLADYLEGKDIRQSKDNFDKIMQAKNLEAPKTPAVDKFDDLFRKHKEMETAPKPHTGDDAWDKYMKLHAGKQSPFANTGFKEWFISNQNR